MEIAELPNAVHPFYFGCQFHPEFLSRPLKPSPPFVGFVRAASGQRDWLEISEPIEISFKKNSSPMMSSSSVGEEYDKCSVNVRRCSSSPQA